MEAPIHMTEDTKAHPERTCVGCRQRDDRDALLRFVLGPDGQLVPDVGRKLPGRGASVHPRRDCLEAAVRRGGFARSLRAAVRVEVDALAETAASQYRRRLAGLLGAARRTGNVVVGTDAVRAQLRDRPPALLVVAEDAAGRREEILETAARLGESCTIFGNKTELGALFDRAELGVLAITDRGIAGEVARTIACVVALQHHGEKE